MMRDLHTEDSMAHTAELAALLDQKVGRIVATMPGAAGVFAARGIDFCCGGDQTLGDAVAHRSLDAEALLGALAAGGPAGEPMLLADTMPSAELIQHIKTRYHVVHLQELQGLIPLAETIEGVHAGHKAVPAGLAAVLRRLRAEMVIHQKREEVVLFPMMLAGGGPMIAAAIATMRGEHDGHGAALTEIDRLTDGRTVPEDGCGSWRALCAALTKLHDDVVTHIHLENNILFPRFERAVAA
jgi:regulator of cell morphogenesis and NO signaling